MKWAKNKDLNISEFGILYSYVVSDTNETTIDAFLNLFNLLDLFKQL